MGGGHQHSESIPQALEIGCVIKLLFGMLILQAAEIQVLLFFVRDLATGQRYRGLGHKPIDHFRGFVI
jgi:hypothetical protein